MLLVCNKKTIMRLFILLIPLYLTFATQIDCDLQKINWQELTEEEKQLFYEKWRKDEGVPDEFITDNIATQITEQGLSKVYSPYIQAFPDSNYLLIDENETIDDVRITALYKYNIETTERELIFSPINLFFSHPEDINAIKIYDFYFFDENNIFIHSVCFYKQSRNYKLETKQIILNIETKKYIEIDKENYLDRFYSHKNLSNRNLLVCRSRKNDENIQIFNRNTLTTKEVNVAQYGFLPMNIFPGRTDSEIAVFMNNKESDKNETILIFWDYEKEKEVKRLIISNKIFTSMQCMISFSPDGKYISFISSQNLFAKGISIINLETGESTDFVNGQHLLRYCNATWSWDSKILYFLSKSNLFKIIME